MTQIAQALTGKLQDALKNPFAKNILIITGGTAFAQLLNILLSPVVTRLYSPEEYGAFTIYGSIVTILALGSFQYDRAIPIASDEEEAMNVFALSTLVLLIFVALITVAISFFTEPVLRLFSNGQLLSSYKLLIPLGILLPGFYNILTQYAYREKSFKALSKTKISQSVAGNFAKISMGVLGFGPLGLILGRILTDSSGIATLLRLPIRNKKNLKHISIKRLLRTAKRYIGFPLYKAPSVFVVQLGGQLPVFFMSLLFGSHVIGFYGLANTIVRLPMNLIGNSVSNVFYAEAASIGKKNPERLKGLSDKLFVRLILLGLIPFGTLSLFGPHLFSYVFGESWYQAGVYARIMSFLVFSNFIFAPISRVYDVFEKQKERLILDVSRIILIIIVFGIAMVMKLNSYWAVVLYTLSGSLMYFANYILSRKIINNQISKKANASIDF